LHKLQFMRLNIFPIKFLSNSTTKTIKLFCGRHYIKNTLHLCFGWLRRWGWVSKTVQTI